jgi:hypothetical protein
VQPSGAASHLGPLSRLCFSDTGLFGDVRLIGDYDKPDLTMIPIGGHFVMVFPISPGDSLTF